MLALVPQLDAYALAMDGLGQRFSSVGAEPGLLDDPTWRIQVAAAFAVIRDANRRVREIQPPARMASAHASLLAMADKLDIAAQHFLTGLDTNNTDELLAGAAAMEEGITLMSQSRAEIEALFAP